MVRNMH